MYKRQVLGTGSAALTLGNLKFRRPQVVQPETNPRKAVKTSSLQLCTSSRRVRKALKAFEGDLASRPPVYATEPGNSSRNDTFQWVYRPLVPPLAFDTPWAKRANNAVRRKEESDIVVERSVGPRGEQQQVEPYFK